jgi:hypothetical protein
MELPCFISHTREISLRAQINLLSQHSFLCELVVFATITISFGGGESCIDENLVDGLTEGRGTLNASDYDDGYVWCEGGI